MSGIQQTCIAFLGIANLVLNLMWWSYTLGDCADKPRPKFLFVTIVISDIVTAIILILGAIGVFG